MTQTNQFTTELSTINLDHESSTILGLPDITSASTSIEDNQDSTALYLPIRSLIICAGILGILGNGLVLYVFIRSQKLNNYISYLFIQNQTVIDFVTAFFIILCHIDFEIGPGTKYNILCKIVVSQWPLWSCVVSSTLNLLVITIERYLIVIHPVRHRNHFNKRMARILCIVVWLTGVVLTFYFAVSSGVQDNQCLLYDFHHLPDILHNLVFFIVGVLVSVAPPFIFIYAYTKMYLNVKKRNEDIGKNHSTTPENETALSKAELNILKTMFIASVCYIVCFFPEFLMFLFSIIGINIPQIVDQISAVLSICNSFVNPFIYIFKFENFRRDLRKYTWFGKVILGGQSSVHSSVITQQGNSQP